MKKNFFFCLASVGLLAAFLFDPKIGWLTRKDLKRFDVGGTFFPNVELVTQDNKKVRFYDDVVKGKTVMLNFMYTQCQGGCIGSTENLVKVQELLGDRMGRDIFFYSISLDATNDTPQALREYAELHETKPGWTFLTGKAPELLAVRKALGFVDPDPKVDARKIEHAGVVVVGNESIGRWISCPALADPKEIVKAFLWMEPDRKNADSVKITSR